MFTLTCILALPDGAVIIGEVAAHSPEQQCAINYRGSIERLPRRFETGTTGDLKVFFENLARELSGTLSFTSSGQYERWAE